jgi:hypothetical protein
MGKKTDGNSYAQLPAVERLIQELAAGGSEPEEGKFTLAREEALAKMKKFQFAEPRRYVLELTRAAVLKKATRIEFAIDADDMRMTFDGEPFTKEDFDLLFNAVFTRRGDPSIRARAGLALGINAAFALEPRRIRVTSGDGNKGAVCEFRPGQPDRIDDHPPGFEGTEIHVKSPVKLGNMGRFVKNLARQLPEERIIKDQCRFAAVEVILDGKRVSEGIEVLAEVPGSIPIQGKGIRGYGGYWGNPNEKSLVHLVQDGVTITSHRIDLYPSGFVAVVESDRLTMDLSHQDVVRDEVYREVMDSVWRIQKPAIRAGIRQQRGSWSWWDGYERVPLVHVPVYRTASPTRVEFIGVWVNGPDDVWIMDAEMGNRLQYNGFAWQARPYDGDAKGFYSETIRAIWWNSSNDVFCSNYREILRFNGTRWEKICSSQQNLNGIWGSAPDNVYAVGNHGTILRYDGTRWNPVDSGARLNFKAVFGSSANNIYAVGSNGLVVHSDGEKWQYQDTRITNELTGVWCNQDVAVAVGHGALIMGHGRSWQTASGDVQRRLNCVWGSGDDDIFAAGDNGVILHYDGKGWRHMQSNTKTTLVSLSGSGPEDVYAVGDSGVVLHYDGSQWHPVRRAMDLAVSKSLMDFIGRGKMFHIDGPDDKKMELIERTMSRDDAECCVLDLEREDVEFLKPSVLIYFQVLRC